MSVQSGWLLGHCGRLAAQGQQRAACQERKQCNRLEAGGSSSRGGSHRILQLVAWGMSCHCGLTLVAFGDCPRPGGQFFCAQALPALCSSTLQTRQLAHLAPDPHTTATNCCATQPAHQTLLFFAREVDAAGAPAGEQTALRSTCSFGVPEDSTPSRKLAMRQLHDFTCCQNCLLVHHPEQRCMLCHTEGSAAWVLHTGVAHSSSALKPMLPINMSQASHPQNDLTEDTHTQNHSTFCTAHTHTLK